MGGQAQRSRLTAGQDDLVQLDPDQPGFRDPLYTPEPDVVHELVGHACTLCHPTLADLNRLFGAAAAQVSDEDLALLERVYWYTMEFGLVSQPEGVKAYGAGLLSSFGELERF